MEIAALITWLITAAGGLVMLGVWLSRGGARTPATAGGDAARSAAGAAGLPVDTATRLRPPLVFGHVLLAVAGLVVWIIYLANDSDALAWTAFVILVPVALLGLTMFVRWIGAGDHRRSAASGSSRPESHFPFPVVIAHGLFAVTTVVLVLLSALEVGGS
jgi:hypothetical protein